MSEVGSKLPPACAWTFVCDSPPKVPARRSTAAAKGERRATFAPGARRSASFSSRFARLRDSRVQKIENMGLCSSTKVLVEKENFSPLPQTIPGSSAQTGDYTTVDEVDGAGCAAGGPAEEVKAVAEEAPIGGSGIPRDGTKGNADLAELEEHALLDSTALLSPDSVEDALGKVPVEAKGAGSLGDEDTILGDEEIFQDNLGNRSAWLSRVLGRLKSGRSVDVGQLEQVSGVEDCLRELVSNRARDLKSLGNVTTLLRSREAESGKREQDIQALSIRLQCSEQDRAGLIERIEEKHEEHRTDRARWFVLKQELETRCTQLESKDAQYRAAIRKKEVDYVRLQDSIRRAIKRDPCASGGGAAASGRLYSRGMESNFELSPGEATTENGQATLGVVLSDQTRRKAEDLEEENADLRSMLLKLQSEVAGIKQYHDRHMDLVSAGRNIDGGVWGGGMDPNPLPPEIIKGMPADWLKRHLGEETSRQILGMRGAVMRVLEGSEEAVNADADAELLSKMDVARLVSQLREARSLLREQDAIMLAAIFDKPGTDFSAAGDPERCVCGGGGGSMGMSSLWDTREQLDQERVELARERAKLERDKVKYLEEAVRRDIKNFVYRSPVATTTTSSPKGGRGATTHPQAQAQAQAGDSTFSSPTFLRQRVNSSSPRWSDSTSCSSRGDAKDFTCLTFTPPLASPDTVRLLEKIGI